MRRGEEQYTVLVMFGDELRCVCHFGVFALLDEVRVYGGHDIVVHL